MVENGISILYGSTNEYWGYYVMHHICYDRTFMPKVSTFCGDMLQENDSLFIA